MATPQTKPATKKPTEPRPVGRPASELQKRFHVRHNDEQLAAWKAAADRDGRSLQDWLRRTLDKAAKPRS